MLFRWRCCTCARLCGCSKKSYSGGGIGGHSDGGGNSGSDGADVESRRGLLSLSPTVTMRDIVATTEGSNGHGNSGGSTRKSTSPPPAKRKNSDYDEEDEEEGLGLVDANLAEKLAAVAKAGAVEAMGSGGSRLLNDRTSSLSSTAGGSAGARARSSSSPLKVNCDRQDFARAATALVPTHSPKAHRVSFGHATVREYDRCLVDHPCVSSGVPLGLDWHFQEHSPEALDAFEEHRRAQGRVSRDEYAARGRLSNQTRLALALHAGAEMSDIQRVAAAVEEEKIRRYESAFSAGAWGGRPQRTPPSSSSSSSSSVSSTAVAWLGGIARLFSTRSGRS